MGKTVKEKAPKNNVEREFMSRFFTDEELDAIIIARIDKARPQTRKKGDGSGVIKWFDYEIEARRQVILDLLRQGLSRRRITEEIEKRWHIAETAARRYIKDATDALAENREDFIAKNREIQTERLEGVLEDALHEKDYKNALKALDQLNKIAGLYTENRQVDVSGEISFEFGGEK